MKAIQSSSYPLADLSLRHKNLARFSLLMTNDDISNQSNLTSTQPKVWLCSC